MTYNECLYRFVLQNKLDISPCVHDEDLNNYLLSEDDEYGAWDELDGNPENN